MDLTVLTAQYTVYFDMGIYGTNGGDTIYGDRSGSDYGDDDFIYGLGGNDYLYGLKGADWIEGGAGNDYIDGGSGGSYGYGYHGYGGPIDIASYAYASYGINASLTYGTSNAIDPAIQDNDTLVNIEGLSGSNYTDSFEGNGLRNFLYGLGGNDGLYGLGGNDYLDGGEGADYLFGGDGDDTLIGGGYDDYLVGDAGFDTADYTYAPVGRTVDLVSGFSSVHVQGPADFDHLFGIEGVVGSHFDDEIIGNDVANRLYGLEGDDDIEGGSGDDTLSGGTGDDDIYGGPGDDFLFGDAGNDYLSGGGGNDQINGGDGDDFIIASATGSVDGGAGVDTLFLYSAGALSIELDAGFAAGSGVSLTLAGIENAYGSAASDHMTGTDVANHLVGNGGNDMMHGLGGNDIMDGNEGDDHLVSGDGDDHLTGGAGADELRGGNGYDTADYSGSAAGVTVDLQAGTGTGGDAQGDWLIGIEAVVGTEQNDIIAGTGNVTIGDYLFGGGGSDQIAGRDGNDLIGGAAGNDVIGGGNGGDDIYGNDGSDNLAGDGGNDRLFGGDGADVLRGGDGADLLVGGLGRDDLFGNAGMDKFQFVSRMEMGNSATTRDFIHDFVRGVDKIDLHFVDANILAANDQAFSFIGKAGFTGVAGQLHYAFSGTMTIVSGDVNGDRVADFQIQLNGNLGLTAGDFLL